MLIEEKQTNDFFVQYIFQNCDDTQTKSDQSAVLCIITPFNHPIRGGHEAWKQILTMNVTSKMKTLPGSCVLHTCAL